MRFFKSKHILLVLLALHIVALPRAQAQDQPTFASYTDANSGTLGDIGFSFSGVALPYVPNPLMTFSLSNNPDWNGVSDQIGRLFLQNDTPEFTINFDSPVTGLEMYLYYFRGAGPGGGGFSSYTFSAPFTVISGLAGVPLNERTFDSSLVATLNGVIRFDEPISTLTVTTTGTAVGGEAGFTIAQFPVQAPEPPPPPPKPVPSMSGFWLFILAVVLFSGAIFAARR